MTDGCYTFDDQMRFVIRGMRYTTPTVMAEFGVSFMKEMFENRIQATPQTWQDIDMLPVKFCYYGANHA